MKALGRIILFACCIFGAQTMASACPSCGVASDSARYAYYGTTALLSLLPLCMVGAVAYLIKKKSK